MRFWIAAVFGFIAMVVITFLLKEPYPLYSPLIGPLCGGLVAGVILGEGAGEGAKVGFVSGIFGALFVMELVLLTGLALFGVLGEIIQEDLGLVIGIFGTFVFGILGLVGGGIGGVFRRK